MRRIFAQALLLTLLFAGFDTVALIAQNAPGAPSGASNIAESLPHPPAIPILQPEPREAKFGDAVSLGAGVTIDVPGQDADDLFAASDLREALHGAHIATPAAAPFTIHLLRAASDEGKLFLAGQKIGLTAETHDEGYALVVGTRDATVIAETSAGIFYGVQTLKQLLPLPGEKSEMRQATIRDWPAMKYRGIDDDLSRGPFPTLAFLKHQIRVFASFKANIYSPYFEHTLEYAENPLAAMPGGSMSEAEAAELVRYATKYHVMIVPEQEAFGHLHHVLKYDIYSDLAETPHGHVLSPVEPGTIPLIHSWFEQIAKEFPAPFVHIGADETFELGLGKTRDRVKTLGYGPTYVDFLVKIHDSLAPLNKRLLFWGDIGGQDPAAVAKLPKDMIAVPWNYWDSKGFETMIKPFKDNGIETWVASGDNNWSQVFPDNVTALKNIQGFIRDGQKMGSTGSLVTVWDDDGEGLFQQDWYGVLFGAAAAWQPGESSIESWQASYGRLFHGDAAGKIDQAQKELMAIYALLQQVKNPHATDTLFWSDPFKANGREIQANLAPIAKQMRLHAEQAILLVAKARHENSNLNEQQALDGIDLGARRFDYIGQRVEYYEEISGAYREIKASWNDKQKEQENETKFDSLVGMNGKFDDLRDALSYIREEYRTVWLSENTPYWLNNVLVRYDLAIEGWAKRTEQYDDLHAQARAGKLPEPEALGLAAN